MVGIGFFSDQTQRLPGSHPTENRHFLVPEHAPLIALLPFVRGISLDSRLASARLVRDLWVLLYSLPTGFVVFRVEVLFLLKATVEPGYGKGRQENRKHIGSDHPNLPSVTRLLPNYLIRSATGSTGRGAQPGNSSTLLMLHHPGGTA
jgi:hypothetical protein